MVTPTSQVIILQARRQSWEKMSGLTAIGSCASGKKKKKKKQIGIKTTFSCAMFCGLSN